MLVQFIKYDAHDSKKRDVMAYSDMQQLPPLGERIHLVLGGITQTFCITRCSIYVVAKDTLQEAANLEKQGGGIILADIYLYPVEEK